MINLILIFLLVALLAPILGLGALAGTALTIVKGLFVVLLVVIILNYAGPSGRRWW